MNASSLCPTCLSQGRKMYRFPLNFTKLHLPAFSRDLKLNPEEMICWECKNFIFKMCIFRNKALYAKSNIATWRTKPWSKLKSLSRLKISKGISLEIIGSPQPDPLLEEEIKTEFDMDVEPDYSVQNNETGDENVEIGNVKKEISDEIVDGNNDDVTIQVFQHKTLVAESNNQKVNDDDVTNDGNLANATLMSLLSRKSNPFSLQSLPNKTLTPTDPVSEDINADRESHPQESRNKPEPPKDRVTNIFIEERLTEEEMRKWWASKRDSEFYSKSIPVFRCEKCVDGFITRRTFLGHQKMHTEMYGDLSCDICELRFKTESDLAAHRDNHYKLLKCVYCDHKWDNPNSMRRHCHREHGAPIKAWNCDVCPKQQHADDGFDSLDDVPGSSQKSTLIDECSTTNQSLNNITKTVKRKKVDYDLDATKRAEETDDSSKESAESDDGETEMSTGSFDIKLESALLLANLEEETRKWLQNVDFQADRALMGLLNDFTFEWSDRTTFNAQREEFTASPGPTFVMDNGTPLSVFRRFFDDDLLDLIVKHTNKYASVLIDRITTENSRLLTWKNTDREELVVFLAIVILQGLAPLNAESDYWKDNGYLTLKYFKDLMTYNRFVLMKRLLRFNNHIDVSGLSLAERKIRKIWPILNELNGKFSSLYIPQQNIVIDDSLFNWHGRRSFEQKIATKARVGIKSCELCEVETGYLWRFIIYTGENIGPEVTNRQGIYDESDVASQNMTESQQATSSTLQNATAVIVPMLSTPLLGNGYTLIMDDFNNSPLLARFLKAQKTDCFGPVRADRAFVPDAIKCVKERVGETLQSFCRDMSITVWRDTNVAMLSTFHADKEKNKSKPDVVRDYNHAISNIEKKRQLLSNYPMERRHQAWHIKIFRRLLNVTLHNAYVIFKSRNRITSRAFRQRLAEEMITACKPEIQSSLVKPRYQEGGRAILDGNHFIGPGATKNASCVWCRRSRSKYVCKQCNVSLCIEVCFEEYHTKP